MISGAFADEMYLIYYRIDLASPIVVTYSAFFNHHSFKKTLYYKNFSNTYEKNSILSSCVPTTQIQQSSIHGQSYSSIYTLPTQI